ncbi:MAG: prepilin-type N-terminal cleavage/methylation domain-containing protein [Candidatus Pacebacteria bacterium]|nr:prepilin-type N-terminal cleavage/methylation domain-containing protein [Candidatus Paceibacterota bacterium]
MKKIIQTAFTLIELLVVIAIIGILSGMIIITMGGITDKANIAKSQVFSNSLRNALMLNLVSEWKLDGNTNDSWGNRNGTISGTVTSTPGCVYGSCYTFGGGYINFGSVLGAGETTVALWFKSSDNSTRSLFSFNGGDRGGLNLNWAGDGKPLLYLASSHYRYFGNMSGYINDKWHFLVLYIAGNLEDDILNSSLKIDTVPMANSSTSHSEVPVSWTNLWIGDGESSPFIGLIDEARVFRGGITSFQIKEMYYAGLNNLFFVGRVSAEEYNQRIKTLAFHE